MPLFVVKEFPKKQVLPAVITGRELTGLRSMFGARIGDAFVSKKSPEGLFLHEIITWRPVWKDGTHQEPQLLERCYRQALELASRQNYHTVAVSLLAREDPGFPRKLQYDIATKVIRDFLDNHEMTVYLVAPEVGSRDNKLLQDVRRFVEDTYIDLSDASTTFILPPHISHSAVQESHTRQAAAPARKEQAAPPPAAAKRQYSIPLPSRPSAPRPAPQAPKAKPTAPAVPPRPAEPAWAATGALPDLAQLVRQTDAGFSETLLRLIDETGKKDSEIYNRANVSRQHFSKIRNNPNYRPTKPTALAFAIALELDLKQTEDLIRRAGYTLSESIVFDVVIMYFIQKQHYNLFDINEALYEFDQVLLGA